MNEAGLIKAAITTVIESESPSAMPRTLTWQGHEFLDAARSDTLWQRAKATVFNATGGLSIELLKDALLMLGRKAIGADG
jgi:hypothetical protein